MIILASFAGSWFGVNFGFRLKKAVFVLGSLLYGDKARQGAVDWINMGKQSVAEGMFYQSSTFECSSLIYKRENDIVISYERAQIYRSVSQKARTQSAIWLLWLLWRDLLSRLVRLKTRSIWDIAQGLMSGNHPKPPTLWINEKLVFETLSVDEALDQLALA